LQGVFGAGLLATGQTILRETFAPEQLGLSQAIFAMGAVVGPALGPPLGGFLVDNASWNWVFEINILPGIVSFLLLSALLRDPEKPRRKPLDLIGLALLVAGVGSFQYLLSEGERYDWFGDGNIVLCAIVAVLGIGGLIVWELRGARTPVVDIAIFKYRSLSTGVGLALIVGAALLGTQYVLPQYVQSALGFTATLSGLLVFVKAVPIAIVTILVAPVVTKFDTRLIIATGFAMTAVSCFWQGVVTTPVSEFSTFAGSLVLGGAAVAFLFVPISVAVLGAVPESMSGSASAWINLSIQLGGSISIALLSMLVDRRDSFHIAALAGQTSHLHALAAPTVAQIAQLAGLVDGQAIVLAYADTSYAVALVALLAIPLVFIMRRPRTGGVVEFGG
jgi:DHA2 family multidrug resistance protein